MAIKLSLFQLLVILSVIVTCATAASFYSDQNEESEHGRVKRYIGWGRRPSMRYSKATSMADFDNLFNKMHNTYDKRGSPDSPISSFRELRMKQKVPNIQNLIPHIYDRPSRSDGEIEAELPMHLTEDDVETLMALLDGYAKSLHAANVASGQQQQ